MPSKQVDVIQSLPCFLDDETSPFGIANILFCGRLVRDRFNVLNQYSKVNWLDTTDSIPEPVETPIADLMDQRANELIAQGSVGVQWSGGVDSTSLLLALIRNGSSWICMKTTLEKTGFSDGQRSVEAAV